MSVSGVINESNIESILWDDWHVVAELIRLTQGGRIETTLLGVRVSLVMDASGAVAAFAAQEPIPALEIKYGLVWICGNLRVSAGDYAALPMRRPL